MTITENKIDEWQDVNLRFKKNKYPVPLNKHLPKQFFVSLCIGSRGSGKTYSICKLLKQYEKVGIMNIETGELCDQRIILFSPTFSANPVFTCLKYLDVDNDVIEEYSDAKLLQIIESVKADKRETDKYQKQLMVYRKFMKCKKIDQLTQEELFILESIDYDLPIKPKYPDGVSVFLILDDLIGSSAFKSVGKSALTNLVLKNRHHGINIIIATQSLKSIPKPIRTNTSLFVIFKFASSKIICEDLYEEVSNIMTLEKFIEVFDYATSEQHDALVIDFSQEKANRIKKNFDTILQIN